MGNRRRAVVCGARCVGARAAAPHYAAALYVADDDAVYCVHRSGAIRHIWRLPSPVTAVGLFHRPSAAGLSAAFATCDTANRASLYIVDILCTEEGAALQCHRLTADNAFVKCRAVARRLGAFVGCRTEYQASVGLPTCTGAFRGTTVAFGASRRPRGSSFACTD